MIARFLLSLWSIFLLILLQFTHALRMLIHFLIWVIGLICSIRIHIEFRLWYLPDLCQRTSTTGNGHRKWKSTLWIRRVCKLVWVITSIADMLDSFTRALGIHVLILVFLNLLLLWSLGVLTLINVQNLVHLDALFLLSSSKTYVINISWGNRLFNLTLHNVGSKINIVITGITLLLLLSLVTLTSKLVEIRRVKFF